MGWTRRPVGWLFDTNVVSAMAAGGLPAAAQGWAATLESERCFISVLTLGEYDKGIANLPDSHAERARIAALRDQIARRFDGRVLPVDAAVARRWGLIAGSVLGRTGVAPPPIDTLIAATAIEHRLYLVSRDVDDLRATGAALFNPWTDEPRRFKLA
ncbi:MAG: type II toxin-antitoxin system VapC family toxin [Alphaproteobacteria bacterium]|jgi:predicted nucleic acid-binding protein|nr:type II toxin-antitoxin system VapC family toxin [Alphaproteobacteria bacterium]